MYGLGKIRTLTIGNGIGIGIGIAELRKENEFIPSGCDRQLLTGWMEMSHCQACGC